MLNFFLNVDEIKPQEVYKKLNEGNELFMLDVREPDEFAHIRIEKSILIPRGNLESGVIHNYKKQAQSLEKAKEKEIIVICRSGARSLYAAKHLKNQGYLNVKSMKTGVLGWAQNGYPVEGSILQNL